jgi:hypothetical protein
MVSERVLDPRPLLGGVQLDGVSVAANMHGSSCFTAVGNEAPFVPWCPAMLGTSPCRNPEGTFPFGGHVQPGQARALIVVSM